MAKDHGRLTVDDGRPKRGDGGVQEALRTRNCESGIANGEVPADGTVGDGGRETGDAVSRSARRFFI